MENSLTKIYKSKTEEYINKKFIWENVCGKWCNRCLKCNKIRNYTKIYNCVFRVNFMCKSCSQKGKTLSDDCKKKISISKLGKKLSNETKIKISNSNKGKVRSEEVRKKISISNTGKIRTALYITKMSEIKRGIKLSEETRKKISIGNRGKIVSDETKKKIRVALNNRILKLGIPLSEDKGAKEWFININKTGYNFKPYILLNLGYRADGYDEQRHIWCEFDTKYHSYLYQQKKDLIRQENIIKYFESNGNPLNGFWRIFNYNENGIIEKKVVYP